MSNPTPPPAQSIQKSTHPGHTLKALLEQNKHELAAVLPKHLTIDRLLKVAMYCYEKVPKLQQCTMASVVTCIKQLAELGLEPGGALGLAYLVPFDDKKNNTTICTLIIGYRGFIELARRSGRLEQIEAHVVHAGDDFEIEFGLEPKLRHVPRLTPNRGAPVAAYCVARLAGGQKHVEVMPWDLVQGIKARSKASSFGPWVTDEEEMARKTVVRRAAKYLPLSPELARAFEVEEEPEGVEVALPSMPEASVLPAETATSKAKAAVRRKLEIKDVAVANGAEHVAGSDAVPPDDVPLPTDADMPPGVA